MTHRTCATAHPRRPIFVHGALLLALSLLATACGGSSGASTPPRISAADLDLGSYSANGATLDTKGGDLANGRAIEAQRIAELVVDPHDVDERFQAVSLPAGALASPSELTHMFSSEDPKLVATRVSGAASSRRFEGANGVNVSLAVMTFDSPAAADRFVTKIGDGNERNGVDPIVGIKTYGSKTTVAGHPTARASLYRVERNDPDPSIAVLEQHGSSAIYLFMTGTGAQLPTMRSVTAKLLDAQAKALDGFEPRHLADMLSLHQEHASVAKLVLPSRKAPSHNEPTIVRTWGPNGALHQQTWAGDLGAAFHRADLDVMAQGGSNVYRAGSPAKAKRLLDDFEHVITDRQYRRFHEPKGLPDARCYRLKTESTLYASNVCQVQVGRYVAEVSGTDADDAEDKVSAQFLVLQSAVRD